MRILERSTVLDNMSSTKTIQHFGTLLKDKPEKLGQVVTMRPDLSISYLTDGLKNIYRQGKTSNEFTKINAMSVQWEIDVNFIKKVKVVKQGVGTGAGRAPITVYLAERYYDKNDTFTLEDKQTLFVIKVPKRIAAGVWEYTCTLTGNDLSRQVNADYLKPGRTTRYRSNYYPELSERGYTKFVDNTEIHQNWMSRHRASVDWSGDFAMREEVYIATGSKGKEKIFKMNKKEKQCMDHFLLTREQNLLFGESNFDKNGKCLDQDEMGKDIPMGDGIIAQIEKVCDKFGFTDLTIDLLEDMIQTYVEKCERPTGNSIALICNQQFWYKFNKLMAEDLRFKSPSDGSWYWSRGKSKYIQLGATFDAYEFAGNTLTVMVDQAMSQEYDESAYAVFIDAGKDSVSGRNNIALFTLEGADMISGTINGMGGQSGKSSGEISTSVHGSSYHLLGYSCAVVFCPYRSLIAVELKG